MRYQVRKEDDDDRNDETREMDDVDNIEETLDSEPEKMLVIDEMSMSFAC